MASAARRNSGLMPTITAPLSEETRALVERTAEAQGRTREVYAADAIRRAAEEDVRFIAALDEGIADLNAVRTLSHD